MYIALYEIRHKSFVNGRETSRSRVEIWRESVMKNDSRFSIGAQIARLYPTTQHCEYHVSGEERLFHSMRYHRQHAS